MVHNFNFIEEIQVMYMEERLAADWLNLSIFFRG